MCLDAIILPQEKYQFPNKILVMRILVMMMRNRLSKVEKEKRKEPKEYYLNGMDHGIYGDHMKASCHK